MRREPASRVSVVLLLLAAVLARTDAAQAREIRCTVRYLSAEHVYLDAGSAAGLDVGLRARVVRGGEAVGELEIVFVAEHSASCRIVSRVGEFVAGDTVLIEIEGEAPEPDREPAPQPIPEPAPRQRSRPSGGGGTARTATGGGIRWRGSVALQWDHDEQTGDGALTTDQLRLPFRLRADEVGRGFSVRARGSLRHIGRDGYGAGTPTGEWRNRIREAALVREGRERDWHIALGRIGSRATAPAGPFDGLAVSRRVGAGARVGVFGGFAPEWGDLGFGTEDHLLGATGRYGRRDAQGRLLDVLLAAVGRYRGGEISRESMTLTTSWRGAGGLSLLQAAEVDFNRGWRDDAGAGAITVSSFSLSGRYRFDAGTAIDLGYDDRSPVRTWETRSLPDSLFEDAGRRGLRAGVGLQPASRLHLHASGGLRRDDRTGDDVVSWRARARYSGWMGGRLSLFASLRGFDGPWLSGSAPAAGASRTFDSGLVLRVEGGRYDYEGALDHSTRKNSWLAVGAEKHLTRKLSLAAEYRADRGDDIVGRRWFLEIRRRF